MALSPPKAIAVFGIEKKKDLEGSTVLFGKQSMEQFPKDFRYTIKIETKSITALKILNWLVHSLKNGYIPDVKLEMENGGSPAENAEFCSPLTISINAKVQAASTLGVRNATSGSRLKIDVKERI